MKLKPQPAAAFTLMEAIVAVAIVGIMLLALYAGLAMCLVSVHVSREDLRATQIMMEKMEVIRLCNWDQVNSNGFVPTSFTAPYSPSTTGGPTYTGTIGITTPATGLVYNDKLRLVTVTVNWQSRNQPHTRTLSTYVSKYGMQNYLFN
jgi:Tfp pilus assembly protein PilV